MSLFVSRDTTYAPGAQVKSADLNNWQDRLLALGNVVMQADVSSFINIVNFTASGNLEPTTVLASASAAIPIVVPKDWEFLAIGARATDTGATAAPTVELEKRVGAIAWAPVAGSVIFGFGGPSSVQTASFSEIIATDTSYRILLKTPGGWTPGVFVVDQVYWVLRRVAP